MPPMSRHDVYLPLVCNGDYGVACFGWSENVVSGGNEPPVGR
jgi:hypothetical protein